MNKKFKYLFLTVVLFLCIAAYHNQKIISYASTQKSSQTESKNGWDMNTLRYYKNGKCLTGFKEIDGRFYYFGKNGKAATGWKNINGKQFYFKLAGGKGIKGSALTGLVKVKGQKYYFGKRGVMQTGWKSINNKKYYFRKAGKTGVKGSAVTGFIKIKGKKFYFDVHGAMQTGWKNIQGKSYYFRKAGASGIKGSAVTGLTKIKNKLYFFDVHGVMRKGLKTIGNNTYYFSASGEAVSGWITYNASCYYFHPVTYVCMKNTVVDGYKVDAYGRNKTRYEVRKLVSKLTNSSMSKDRKIEVLFDYVTSNSWDYKRTYEHVAPDWVWYKGWTDDFAYDLISTGHGNCYRYAAVLGYMVKEACGYDVRIYCGKMIARRGGTTPHGWTNVKINGKWYTFDPDMYKFNGKYGTYYYHELNSDSYYNQKDSVYTDLQ